MAENPIRKEDIIDGAGISATLKEIIDLLNGEFKQALINIQKEAGSLKTSLAGVNATTADGQQAIRTITEQTNTLNAEYIKTSAAVKELEKAERSRIKIEQEEIKYGKIMPGSYKDITSKLKQLREETLRMSSVQAQKNIPQIKAYEERLKKLDAEMGRHQRNVGNYATALKGLGTQLLSITGATAGVAGAIKIFKGIIDSTETSALAFEATMKGASDAVSAMFKAFAAGDFKNLFTNMRDAFRAGKEFALAMDEAEDKTRAFEMAEADALKQTIDLTKTARDATKSNKERIAAIDEIINIEEKLAQRRESLAREELDLQLTRTAKLNKISKEELLAYIKRDEALMANVESGQRFLDVLKNLDTSTQSAVYSAISLGQTMLPDKLYIPKEVRDSWQAQVEAMTAADRANMQLAANLGNVTDAEADAITSLYKEVKVAEVAAEQNTMRMFSRRQSLIEELIKSEKKITDAVIPEAQRREDSTIKLSQDAATIRIGIKEKETKKLKDLDQKYYAERERLTREELASTLNIVSDGLSVMTDLYSAQKQRELNAAGDNAEKREEIEKKYFKKEKTLSISQAIVNGALAVTKAQAQTGVLSFLTIPLIIAQTLGQIAIISSQKFAKGGFTGKGTRRDETGERIAGVVHENEFVINKKQTRKYRPLLDAIHKDDQLAIATAINNSNLVWDNTAKIINRQDPYTEKMYNLMRNTPTTYVNSSGNTVLRWPDGRVRVIKKSIA